MPALVSLALLLASAQQAAALSAEASQAHDEAKLLREKLPQDVSDDTVLDLTTKLLTRGVPTEVLKWYLNDEMTKGRTGEALVRDVEALATTMGGGARMQGTPASLIELIKADEAVPDASLDAPFIWPESEHLEDVALLQKSAAPVEEKVEEGQATKASEQPVAKADIEKAETDQAKTETAQAGKAEADTGLGTWDVVFFMLLGLVAVVGAWWAYKMRLHDRALSGLADLTFRAKKWVSGALKGGHDYQAQGDDASSVSDTSLQTGSAATGTSASSNTDGLNGHLQGVIDRVKSNFQQKDGQTADEEAPAKKGYTRRT